MPATPIVVHRVDQPYLGISGSVSMGNFGPLIERHREVFSWLAQQGISPAGAPFFRYHIIDMAGQLEMEVGVPVASDALPGLAVQGDLQIGVLPAGRYAAVTHVGHPNELVGATGALLAWADQHGLRWDMTPSAVGERWAARLENYLTDPADEPDMTKWHTELAFKLVD